MDKIAVKADIKRDSDGFEDIEDFWELTEPGRGDFLFVSLFLCLTLRRSVHVSVVAPAPVKVAKGALSKVADEYDTSDEISDEEEDNSTRFSYDTNRTIDMSMNTTAVEEAEEQDYGPDDHMDEPMDDAQSADSSAASSRRNSGAKSSGATPLSVLKSGGSTGGNRRVSFGSPIMHDQANTPYSEMSAANNNSLGSVGLGSSGRRSSAGSSSSRRSSVSSAGSGSELEESMMTNVTSISTPGSTEFPRGRVLADETFVQHGDGAEGQESGSESEEEATMDDSGFTTDDSLVRSAMKRVYRDDSSDEDASVDSEEERNGPCRRSKRQTKGQKFQFWKNERAVYDRGSMIGFLQAEPTPKKPKRATKAGQRGGGATKKLKFSKEYEEPVKPVVLPKGVKYLERDSVEELNVWDETKDDIVESSVVCLHERVNPLQLPPAESRPNNKKHLVGLAAQSFNVKESPDFMSSWISGFVELPPHGIKDPECVGDCAQVFFVAECQDEALEFALADPKDEDWNEKLAQRLLLKTRDSFYVPPGNVYRLENHSSTKSCVIYWTIIKALSNYKAGQGGVPASNSANVSTTSTASVKAH